MSGASPSSSKRRKTSGIPHCDDGKKRAQADGGLLYYLKTGNLLGVPLMRGDTVALMMRRNELASYQNSHPRYDRSETVDIEDEKVAEASPSSESQQKRQKEFPGLIAKKRKCEWCFQKKECFIFNKAQAHNQGASDVSEDNITASGVAAA